MKVLKTNDYSTFKTIKGNRKIYKAHVNKLATSIAKDPAVIEYSPVLVNEKGEIIDGQHRVEACKKLGLPVYYYKVPGLSIETVKTLNSSAKVWSPLDYAHAYASSGNKNYIDYLNHKNKYKLNHDITMGYCGMGNPNTSMSFKEGRFKSGDQKLAIKFTEQLMDIGEYLPHFKLRSTALALLSMMQNEHYDHERMLHKMKLQGDKVARYTQYEDSIRELEKHYNKNAQNGDRVRFF